MPDAHHHQHHDQGETDWEAMAQLLDLDAEVLRSHHAEVTTWVCGFAAGLPVRRILDVGTGTGSGALALAKRFAQADVIALDVSAELLGRCMATAREAGVADRIHPVQADLNAAWPVVGAVELAWASRSLHHLAAPDRVLTDLFATICPGGVLALAEIESFPRFLPYDVGLGTPGLEERCHAALAESVAHELPHLGSDWAALLRRAGFTIRAERTFAVHLEPPLPAAAGRYAQASLRRLRSGLPAQVSAGDLAALDALIDADGPEGVLRRADLTVRARRTVWVASRP